MRTPVHLAAAMAMALLFVMLAECTITVLAQVTGRSTTGLPLDVYLLMDRSGSVAGEIGKFKQFAQDLHPVLSQRIGGYHESPEKDGLKYSLLTFSCENGNADVRLPLTGDIDVINEELSKPISASGKTCIYGGYEYVRRAMNESAFVEPVRPQVLIVLTDGVIHDFYEGEEAAKNGKYAQEPSDFINSLPNAVTFAVAVGNQVNRDQLLDIVTDNDEDKIFDASFDSLASMVDLISSFILNDVTASIDNSALATDQTGHPCIGQQPMVLLGGRSISAIINSKVQCVFTSGAGIVYEPVDAVVNPDGGGFWCQFPLTFELTVNDDGSYLQDMLLTVKTFNENEGTTRTVGQPVQFSAILSGCAVDATTLNTMNLCLGDSVSVKVDVYQASALLTLSSNPKFECIFHNSAYGGIDYVADGMLALPGFIDGEVNDLYGFVSCEVPDSVLIAYPLNSTFDSYTLELVVDSPLPGSLNETAIALVGDVLIPGSVLVFGPPCLLLDTLPTSTCFHESISVNVTGAALAALIHTGGVNEHVYCHVDAGAHFYGNIPLEIVSDNEAACVFPIDFAEFDIEKRTHTTTLSLRTTIVSVIGMGTVDVVLTSVTSDVLVDTCGELALLPQAVCFRESFEIAVTGQSLQKVLLGDTSAFECHLFAIDHYDAQVPLVVAVDGKTAACVVPAEFSEFSLLQKEHVTTLSLWTEGKGVQLASVEQIIAVDTCLNVPDESAGQVVCLGKPLEVKFEGSSVERILTQSVGSELMCEFASDSGAIAITAASATNGTVGLGNNTLSCLSPNGGENLGRVFTSMRLLFNDVELVRRDLQTNVAPCFEYRNGLPDGTSAQADTTIFNSCWGSRSENLGVSGESAVALMEVASLQCVFFAPTATSDGGCDVSALDSSAVNLLVVPIAAEGGFYCVVPYQLMQTESTSEGPVRLSTMYTCAAIGVKATEESESELTFAGQLELSVSTDDVDRECATFDISTVSSEPGKKCFGDPSLLTLNGTTVREVVTLLTFDEFRRLGAGDYSQNAQKIDKTGRYLQEAGYLQCQFVNRDTGELFGEASDLEAFACVLPSELAFTTESFDLNVILTDISGDAKPLVELQIPVPVTGTFGGSELCTDIAVPVPDSEPTGTVCLGRDLQQSEREYGIVGGVVRASAKGSTIRLICRWGGASSPSVDFDAVIDTTAYTAVCSLPLWEPVLDPIGGNYSTLEILAVIASGTTTTNSINNDTNNENDNDYKELILTKVELAKTVLCVSPQLPLDDPDAVAPDESPDCWPLCCLNNNNDVTMQGASLAALESVSDDVTCRFTDTRNTPVILNSASPLTQPPTVQVQLVVDAVVTRDGNFQLGFKCVRPVWTPLVEFQPYDRVELLVGGNTFLPGGPMSLVRENSFCMSTGGDPSTANVQEGARRLLTVDICPGGNLDVNLTGISLNAAVAWSAESKTDTREVACSIERSGEQPSDPGAAAATSTNTLTSSPSGDRTVACSRMEELTTLNDTFFGGARVALKAVDTADTSTQQLLVERDLQVTYKSLSECVVVTEPTCSQVSPLQMTGETIMTLADAHGPPVCLFYPNEQQASNSSALVDSFEATVILTDGVTVGYECQYPVGDIQYYVIEVELGSNGGKIIASEGILRCASGIVTSTDPPLSKALAKNNAGMISGIVIGLLLLLLLLILLYLRHQNKKQLEDGKKANDKEPHMSGPVAGRRFSLEEYGQFGVGSRVEVFWEEEEVEVEQQVSHEQLDEPLLVDSHENRRHSRRPSVKATDHKFKPGGSEDAPEERRLSNTPQDNYAPGTRVAWWKATVHSVDKKEGTFELVFDDTGLEPVYGVPGYMLRTPLSDYRPGTAVMVCPINQSINEAGVGSRKAVVNWASGDNTYMVTYEDGSKQDTVTYGDAGSKKDMIAVGGNDELLLLDGPTVELGDVDANVEYGVAGTRIRFYEPKFVVGAVVECQVPDADEETWARARVVTVLHEDLFEVKFDRAANLPAEHVEMTSDKMRLVQFHVGDIVEALPMDPDNENGIYKNKMKQNEGRRLAVSEEGGLARFSDDDDEDEDHGDKWRRAQVVKVNDDNTYGLMFDDNAIGEKERIGVKHIRVPKYFLGEMVEVNKQGDWCVAKITKCNKQGATYDVLYEKKQNINNKRNAESTERYVLPPLIRRRKPPVSFKVGDLVDIKRDGAWVSGSVVGIDDGRYDVEYDPSLYLGPESNVGRGRLQLQFAEAQEEEPLMIVVADKQVAPVEIKVVVDSAAPPPPSEPEPLVIPEIVIQKHAIGSPENSKVMVEAALTTRFRPPPRQHSQVEEGPGMKPATLRFKRKAPLEFTELPGNKFEVTVDMSFGLGVSLGWTKDSKVIVASFKDIASGDWGPLEACGLIGLKDQLLAVNGYSILGLSFTDVSQMIQRSPGAKVCLKFGRWHEKIVNSVTLTPT